MKKNRGLIMTLIGVLLISISGVNAFAQSEEFVIAGEWEKYEPCCELVVDNLLREDSIIAGKTTGKNPFVIWTCAPVDEAAQNLIVESLQNVPGVGKIKNVQFISGDGADCCGIQILKSEDKIVLDHPSSWSLLYCGSYQLKSNDSDIASGEEVIPDKGNQPEEKSEGENPIGQPEENLNPGKTDPTEETPEGENPIEQPEENNPQPDGILDRPESGNEAVIPASPQIQGPGTDITELPIITDISIPAYDYAEQEMLAPLIAKIDRPETSGKMPVTEHILDEQPKTGFLLGAFWRALIIAFAIAIVATAAVYVFKRKDEN